jgi:hypothetical protein
MNSRARAIPNWNSWLKSTTFSGTALTILSQPRKRSVVQISESWPALTCVELCGLTTEAIAKAFHITPRVRGAHAAEIAGAAGLGASVIYLGLHDLGDTAATRIPFFSVPELADFEKELE